MKKFFGEFRDFIVQGNALNLAIGVVIGAAFGAIVNSLVQDIIMPPIGLLLGKVDFSNLYIKLTEGEFSSLADAQAKGAVVIAYGKFIMAIVSFLIIAFVIFLLLRAINKAREKAEAKLKVEKKEEEATTKACPFCATDIPLAATRCPHCTSQLDR